MSDDMRELVLDIETTGLSPLNGHRIVEIGGLDGLAAGIVRAACETGDGLGMAPTGLKSLSDVAVTSPS
jgi:hypothetical protein